MGKSSEILRNTQKSPSNTPIKNPKQSPRQQICEFTEILTKNITSFNVSELGNWHLMPFQPGLAILQGAQNCNRRDSLWHFEARAVSYP